MKKSVYIVFCLLFALPLMAQTDQLRVKRMIVSESPWVDIRSQSTSDISAGSVSAAAALTAACAVGNPVLIPSGSYLIDSSMTCAAPIVYQGGMFTSANSSTLTLTGPQSGGESQRFSGSLIIAGLKDATPDMFATNTTPGTTDMASAIQKAINAVGSNNGTVSLTGRYAFGTGLLMPNKMTLRGTGNMSEQSSVNAGSTLIKKAALNGIGIYVTGAGARLDGFLLDGESGNGGDGIQMAANGASLTNITVNRQGGNGIRIGADTSINSNSFRLDNIKLNRNGSNGLYIHSNTGASPDANAGTITQVTSNLNTGDGVKVGNAWLNTLVGVTVQANTGYGIELTSDSQNTRVVGGDQEEVNVAGNIQNAGVGNIFFGVSNTGFVDAGTNTTVVSRTTNYVNRIGLGTVPSGNAVLNAGVAFSGIEEIARYKSDGNSSPNRGFSFLYDLPVSGGSATGVKFVMARGASGETSYYAIHVKQNGVALAETFRLDASVTAGDTRMMIYDVDTGAMQRVSVGANDSGGTGFRMLRIPNTP